MHLRMLTLFSDVFSSASADNSSVESCVISAGTVSFVLIVSSTAVPSLSVVASLTSIRHNRSTHVSYPQRISGVASRQRLGGS